MGAFQTAVLQDVAAWSTMMLTIQEMHWQEHGIGLVPVVDRSARG